MSPEQAQGNKAIDTRSDLWSLGVIAFECLIGKRPFYSDGLGDLVLQICIREIPVPSEYGSVPIGFDAWFARACARDPDARFQSARELTDALREVLGGDVRELRELQWTSTEAVIATEEAPNSQARTRIEPSEPPSSSAPTLAVESNSQIRLTSGSVLDQHAATVAAADAPPSSRSSVPLSLRADSAVIAELLANANSEPPRKRSGAALVFSVAGIALAIGLAAGLVFMKRNDSHLRPLPKAVPPAHEEAEAPKAHLKAPEHAPSAREEAVPAPSASAKPSSAAHIEPEGIQPAPAKAATAASVTPAATAPDAGWVKPAWAIPDDEPRRVHSDDRRDAGN
jgi:serine/threonine-protein kinase